MKRFTRIVAAAMAVVALSGGAAIVAMQPASAYPVNTAFHASIGSCTADGTFGTVYGTVTYAKIDQMTTGCYKPQMSVKVVSTNSSGGLIGNSCSVGSSWQTSAPGVTYGPGCSTDSTTSPTNEQANFTSGATIFGIEIILSNSSNNTQCTKFAATTISAPAQVAQGSCDTMTR